MSLSLLIDEDSQSKRLVDLLTSAGHNVSGILLVHQGSEKAKNMTRQAIIRAIHNLETAGVALSGQCIRLNQWMY